MNSNQVRWSYKVAFPVYQGARYDASTTNLTYKIVSPEDLDSRPVTIVLSFLSPITPTSTLRQSLPATYISVHASGSLDLDVYIDVNGQWVSGDRGSHIKWEHHPVNAADSSDTSASQTWRVVKAHESPLNEYNDRAEWGSLYVSGPSVSLDVLFRVADGFISRWYVCLRSTVDMICTGEKLPYLILVISG